MAGAAGSGTMVAGLALFDRKLRRISVWSRVAAVGAIFGLLLPVAMRADMISVLLVPWQATVVGVIGYDLARGFDHSTRK